MSAWTTRTLAAYVCDQAAVRPTAAQVTAAGRALIDLLGCAAAGFATPAARLARASAAAMFADGPSRLWFTPATCRPEGAALANSTAASALDLDDGHRRAGGHPGAAVVPTVLALAPPTGADGQRLVAALNAGYEVAVRVAAARDFARLDTLSTGRWAAYGTVAAAGLLGGDTPEILAQAFGIAGVLSPNLSAAGYSTVMGNQVKEGIPWAVLTGLAALEMARRGLTGPLDILDHPDYFDARAVVAQLGTGGALDGIYFKPYACCRWSHAAIDALLAVTADPALDLGRLRALDVFTFARALRLSNEVDPATLEGAQYSLPFCLAVAALGGAEALLPLQPEWLHRPDVIALAERVKLHVDPDLEAGFPAEAGARVRLTTDAGSREQTVRAALGDPANPLDGVRLEAKFRRLAAGVLDAERQNRLLSLIAQLDTLDHSARLIACLEPAGDGPRERKTSL